MLTISTLGRFAVRFDAREVAGIGTGKLAALLAYLAVEPGPHRRDAVAEMFWPTLPTRLARSNLRQSLFQLRNLLESESSHSFIESSRTHVELALATPWQVDVHAFRRCRPPTLPPAPGSEAVLDEMADAIGLYKGQFLAGVMTPDSDDFEGWLSHEREFLHRHALKLLDSLSLTHQQKGNLQKAIDFALRAIQLNPLDELLHLRVMQLYLAANNPALAIDQYESCRRLLERELGGQPRQELRDLAEPLLTLQLALGFERGVAVTKEQARPSLEHRRLVVLYCQFLLPQGQDLEKTFDFLREQQQECERLIRQFGGHVVRPYGGGLLAYFGYPVALEHASRTALSAAWSLVSSRNTGVRASVHRGEVVTEAGGSVPDPLGITTDTAVRLVHLANYGEVVFSASLAQQAKACFQFVPLSSPHPRLTSGEAIYRLVGGRVMREGSDIVSPFCFVGRERELRELHGQWENVVSGSFASYMISGEAGVGKSRLAGVFLEATDTQEAFVAAMYCYPEYRNSPLWPVVRVLESLCCMAQDDTPALRADKLRLFLKMHQPEPDAILAASLAKMLDVELADISSQPDECMKMLPVRLAGLLGAMAQRQPLIFLADDVQWADKSTLDVLDALLDHAPARMFVLVTAREESCRDGAPWHCLSLRSLSQAETGELVQRLRPDLSAETLARIAERADGLPLFAEELAVLDDPEQLPENLADLLMSRLDDLGPAKAVAQMAACLGRQFDAALLRAACRQNPRDFEAHLQRLLDSGLIQTCQDGLLQFRHALVQEAAYRSQARSVRMENHGMIALLLESRRHSLVPETLEIMAFHWSIASDPRKAAEYWLAAGNKATANFALSEAEQHFQEGLSQLPLLNKGKARNLLEVDLLLGLAQCRQRQCGYGNEEVQDLLARSLNLLGDDVSQSRRLFRVLWGQWEGGSSRIGHHESYRIAQELLKVAEKSGDHALRQQAHYARGVSLFWQGEFCRARRCFETAVALEPAETGSPARNDYGLLTLSAAKSFLALIFWMRGDHATAIESSDFAIAVAKRHQDRFGMAFALTCAAAVHRWNGDLALARQFADEGLNVARECQATALAVFLSTVRGWAAVREGRYEAIRGIEDSVADMRKTRSGIMVLALAPLAETLLQVGEHEKSTAVLEEAIALSESKHDKHYLAELHRLLGLCFERQGHVGKARAAFEKALQICQQQGAVVFQMRALRSLEMLGAG